MKILITELQLDYIVDNGEPVNANEDDIPEMLFHATFESNLDNMWEFGIGSKRSEQRQMSGGHYLKFYNSDGVFLSSDIDDAIEYVAQDERRGNDRLVVIHIPKSALDLSKLYYDTNNGSMMNFDDDVEMDPSELTFYYKGVIDPKKTSISFS